MLLEPGQSHKGPINRTEYADLYKRTFLEYRCATLLEVAALPAFPTLLADDGSRISAAARGMRRR